MFNISAKTKWFIIILAIQISIYYIFLNKNIYDNFEHNDMISSRKKINKKYKKSKQIHNSPNIQHDKHIDSIKLMTDKLKNRISKTKINVINKNKKTIKLFFADWCDHCKNFKPIWEKTKKKYIDKILFITIDCTTINPNLNYVINLPTIAIYDSTNKYIENYKNDKNFLNFDIFVQSLL